MQPENENGAQKQNPAAPGQNRAAQTYSLVGQPAASFSQASLKNKRKKLIIGIAALAVLLIGASAGAYFGIYLPNKPENVWNKALENTAAGYDKLVDYSEEQKDKKGGIITGDFKLDADQTVVDGKLETKYYEKVSTTRLDAGASGTRVNLDLITNVPEGSKYPDVYAKVSGLKGIDGLLGAEAAGLGQSLASIDNQWYVLDHTFFDQIEKEATAKDSDGEPSMPTFTQEDITSIARAVGTTNRQYLFTENTEDTVFKRTQNIGKEKLDERDVYHYKVGYDKENLKAYINALKEELKKTKLNDYINNRQFDEAIKSVDELDGSGEADAWVDLKTKLVRKVRFTEAERPDAFVDVGLRYNGGDEYPFFTDIVSNETSGDSKVNINLTLNTKENTIKLGADADSNQEAMPLKFNLNAILTPGNERVEFEEPDDAKPLLEAYGKLVGSGTSQPSSDDGTEL